MIAIKSLIIVCQSKKIIFKRFKILSLIFFFVLMNSCSQDDDGTTSSLPSITTEGKNTFGCKIDGQTFLPRDAGGLNINDPVPTLRAIYVFNEFYFDGYMLSIFADNEILRKTLLIEMTASDTPLEEGEIYPITIKEDGNIHASYDFVGELVDNGDGTGYQPFFGYRTTNQFTGELEILKLDTENQIISGTFWFDCEEVDNGEIVAITEGRFDINYTTNF